MLESNEPASSPEEIFERVVVPEIELLTRVAYSLTRNSHSADDLVQETLLRAFRSIGTYDGRNARPWLLTIMRNTNINLNRRRRPALVNDFDLAMEQLESEPSSADLPPEEAAVSNEFVELVMEAVGRLPEKLRSVIEMVDVEGLSYAEAAAVLGIPKGTVMSRIHRGRLRIRAEIPVERVGAAASGDMGHKSRRSQQ